MPGRSLGILAAGVLAACSPRSGPSGDGSGSNGSAAPTGTTFTLFALAEVRGQIEPCGCTTDPLGDISRTSRMIADARARGPVVVVDAGGLLYSKAPVPAHLVAQEELKADLLASLYQDTLMVAAVGIGRMDLAAGPSRTRVPRSAANLVGDAIRREAPRVIDAGGAKVGVFGVVAPAAAGDGVEAGDPITAGKAAIADLKKKGAAVVVALVQAPSKKDAFDIVRGFGGGVDLAVLGLGAMAPEPADVSPRAEDVDGTWVVIPGNRGQVVSRLEVTVRPGGKGLVDAIGPAAAAAELASIDVQLRALDEQLDAFAKDPAADPAFVATKQAERVQLAAERDALAASPVRRPAAGSYFTLDQVRITKKLACDAAVDEAKATYDRAAGEANVKAAADAPPLPVPKGTATYVGGSACSDCHGEQAEFWDKTKHAGAWETLEERGKQFDFDCIGCHVVGWDKPGGSTLANNEPYRDVQCEVCHGPGSIHVDKDGAKGTIARAPAPELCATQCHTKEHSDTFALEPYLRDIVGPGHGEKRRKALGDGPTGQELRAAGLAKAGAALGEGCRK
jgi:hypothetical protein